MSPLTDAVSFVYGKNGHPDFGNCADESRTFEPFRCNIQQFYSLGRDELQSCPDLVELLQLDHAHVVGLAVGLGADRLGVLRAQQAGPLGGPDGGNGFLAAGSFKISFGYHSSKRLVMELGTESRTWLCLPAPGTGPAR